MTVGTPIYPDNTRDSGSTLKGRLDDVLGVSRRLAGPFAPYASVQFDFIPGDVSTADDTITRANHNLFASDKGRFTTTDTLPAGLALLTDYFVLASGLTADDLKVSLSDGGAAVNITDVGSGIHTFTRTANLKAAIAKGFIWDGTTLVEVAAQQTAALVAPTTGPRIDRLVISDSTGVLSVITGAEAVSGASAPAITAGSIPVGQITWEVGQAEIVNADLTDERALPTRAFILASQAEAEAGIENTKAMTALRTAQREAVSITGATAETAPAVGDLLLFNDISVPGNRKITFQNFLKVLNALTEDMTPDAAADFLLAYDTSASAVKKVLMSKVGGGTDTFRAYRGTAQTLNDNTWTKIQFATESFDPQGWYDAATNYRFTPLTAGKYLVTVSVTITNTANLHGVAAAVYKNGSAEAVGIIDCESTVPAGLETNLSYTITALVDMNGTTDYIEGYGYQNSFTGTSADVAAGASVSYFSAARVST